MSDFEYLVVPFVAKTGTRKRTEAVSEQLQDVLNHYARYGWVYQRLELINVEYLPGCLGIAFDGKPRYMRNDVLVFRRPKKRAVTTEDTVGPNSAADSTGN